MFLPKREPFIESNCTESNIIKPCGFMWPAQTRRFPRQRSAEKHTSEDEGSHLPQSKWSVHQLRSLKKQMLEVKADQRLKPCENCDAAWGSSATDTLKYAHFTCSLEIKASSVWRRLVFSRASITFHLYFMYLSYMLISLKKHLPPAPESKIKKPRIKIDSETSPHIIKHRQYHNCN